MWKILHGDVARVVKTLPDNHFDAMLSDPPYGLSFMGRAWDYSVPSALTWSGIERVLKPGAPALIFGGSLTFHRLMVAVEDGGFEPRDLLMWIYGSGLPKHGIDRVSAAIDKALGAKRKVVRRERRMNEASGIDDAGRGQRKEVVREITAPTSDLAKDWSGYASQLKPSYEPVALVRKFTEETIARNAMRWGVGALSIEASRITGCTAASVGPINATGYQGADVEGRWPPNVIFDREAAVMLDEQTGNRPGMRSGGTHRAGYAKDGRVAFGSPDAKVGQARGDSGGASRFHKVIDWDPIDHEIAADVLRFYYSPKADRYQREAGLAGRKQGAKGADALRDGDRSEGAVGNTHPTVKPIELIRYLARLILPPARDTPRRILVPYAGVSSEMIGCLQAGWDEVIGIEREAGYIEIATARITKGGVLSGLMDRTMRVRGGGVMAGRSIYGVFADEGDAGKARRSK